jgi:hypothetical protein
MEEFLPLRGCFRSLRWLFLILLDPPNPVNKGLTRFKVLLFQGYLGGSKNI